MDYPNILKKLLDELQRLPGVGAKTAERLAFHLLKSSEEEVLALSDAIRQLKKNIKHCRHCFHITEDDPCNICRNPQRDAGTICVVEQPKDLWAIEKTGCYDGVYHVLMGRLAPLDGEHAEQLTVQALLDRISKSLETPHPVREVILATNPNLEGDTTSLYLKNALENFPITISRIARGISAGSSIEFANEAILSDALNDRKTLKKN